jgi:hypothetical protein
LYAANNQTGRTRRVVTRLPKPQRTYATDTTRHALAALTVVCTHWYEVAARATSQWGNDHALACTRCGRGKDPAGERNFFADSDRAGLHAVSSRVSNRSLVVRVVYSAIYSAGADKTVSIWDVERAERVRKFAAHSSFVNSCCPSRRGTPLLVSGKQSRTKRAQPLPRRPVGHTHIHLLVTA